MIFHFYFLLEDKQSSSMGEFDNTNLYNIFDLIFIDNVTIFYLIIPFYFRITLVFILFQVFALNKDQLSKEIKLRKNRIKKPKK